MSPVAEGSLVEDVIRWSTVGQERALPCSRPRHRVSADCTWQGTESAVPMATEGEKQKTTGLQSHPVNW